MEYYYLEKKPFKVNSLGLNTDTKKCKLIVEAGKLHFLDPHVLNQSYIDVEGAEKDILESNLTVLEATEKTNKVFVKITHNRRTIYENLTEIEKEHFKQGFLNKKMGTGSYTSNKGMVGVLNAKIYADSEVPEYNESETYIELAEVNFSSNYVDISQKLKSDIFFYPTYLGNDSDSSSEESSSEESDSSYYSSYESSDESSDTQPSDTSYYYSSYDSSYDIYDSSYDASYDASYDPSYIPSGSGSGSGTGIPSGSGSSSSSFGTE